MEAESVEVSLSLAIKGDGAEEDEANLHPREALQ